MNQRPNPDTHDDAQGSKGSAQKRSARGGRHAGSSKRNLAATTGIALFLLALAVVLAIRAWPRAESAQSSTVSAELLAYGEEIYQANCAACHGSRGEGYAQPELPAPALDESEHAWHHADEQIIGIIRQGGARMPAVGAEWSDRDVEAVLSYIKQWWTPQQRAYQPGAIGE